jgi:ABC-type Co2+ transport system permease subunit
MHIEPGLVVGAKIILSYATAAAASIYALKLASRAASENGIAPIFTRTILATVLVFAFFEVLPHYPVGVSEVHLILASTLFLLLGPAPAALGLAFGLLVQGLFFEPQDLPQYGMNVTTLLVPLFGLAALADRIIPCKTPYVDLRYSQALALSTSYQGGVVVWVAFWALYGGGVNAATLSSISSFGAAYMLVVLIEPLADLAVLAAAKSLQGLRGNWLFAPRPHGTSA